jgi:hypothetical chaperone protein
MYESAVAQDIRHVRKESKQPELFGRLLRVLDEQRGHTLAMDVESSKIALSEAPRAGFSLDWIERGLRVDLARADLVAHTSELADGIAARIGRCLAQAGLGADGIDAVFLTGGSVQLAHVRSAIIACVPNARVVEGDTFGAVGKGLTIEAARRYGTVEVG